MKEGMYMSFEPKEFVEALGDKNAIKKFLTAQAKKDISTWIDTKVIPTAKDAVAEFNKALAESAEKETGWCKIRDKLFIPMVLNIILWVFTQTSTIIQSETNKQ
jgi:hypothetical protein